MIDEIRAIDTRSGTLIVLLTLNAAGELRFSELCRQVRLDRGSVRRAIDVLETSGLVARQEDSRFPFGRRLRITPFGCRVMRAPVAHWPSLFFERATDLGTAALPPTGRTEGSRGEPPRSIPA